MPGRVKALTDLVAKVPAVAPPGARVLDLATSANSATDVRMAAEELDSAFAQNRQAITWLALAPVERAQLQSQVRVARDRAAAAETTLRNAANVIVNADATQAAVHGEAALIARTLAKIRKAEADRAAEAARRAAAALEAQVYAEAEAQAREEKDKKDGGGSKRVSGKNGGSDGGSGKKNSRASHFRERDRSLERSRDHRSEQRIGPVEGLPWCPVKTWRRAPERA